MKQLLRSRRRGRLPSHELNEQAQDDPIIPADDGVTRPGAFAVHGIDYNPSNDDIIEEDNSSTSQAYITQPHVGVEHDEHFGTQQQQPGQPPLQSDEPITVTLIAERVDEAAEEERINRLAAERVAQLEAQRRRQQPQLVTAVAEEVVTHENGEDPPNYEGRRIFKSLYFWISVGFAVLLAVVIVVTLSVTLRNDDNETTKPTVKSTPQPTATPEPTAAPTKTSRPSFQPTTWTQLGADILGEHAGSRFGNSVALSGDGTILAVGATLNDEATTMNAGRVRVFRFNRVTRVWDTVGPVGIDGKAEEDRFGSSVCLSTNGNIIAAGTDIIGASVARVYIYDTVNNIWNQMGQDIDNLWLHDWVSRNVALSGDGTILAVSTHSGGEVEVNGEFLGEVRVFVYNGNQWTQRGQTLVGDTVGDRFGASLALSNDGTTLAVGAYTSDKGSIEAGRVSVHRYNVNDNLWTQLGDNLYGEKPNDRLGFSVALSLDGSIMAAGAYWNDDGGWYSGHIRVFEYNQAANEWTQIGRDIAGESAGNTFGQAVALSLDGMTVAGGAPLNRENGHASGQVRVFRLKTNQDEWQQVGQDLNGQNADDWFGIAVALSSDGTIVATGAYLDDSNGDSSGLVQVFEAQS